MHSLTAHRARRTPAASRARRISRPGRRSPIDALDGLDPVLLVAGKEVPGKSAFSVTRGELHLSLLHRRHQSDVRARPGQVRDSTRRPVRQDGEDGRWQPFRLHRARREDLRFRQRRLSQEVPGGAGEVPGHAPRSPPGLAQAPRHAGASSSSARSQAIGGAARLDALTSYVESFSQTQKRPQGEATITDRGRCGAFPDRVRQERTIALQGKTMSSATILAPQGMWFVGGQGRPIPMRPASRPSLEQDFGRHPVALLRARRSPAFKAVALGTTTVDGVGVERVRIVSGETDVTLAHRGKRPDPQRDLPRPERRWRVRHVHRGATRTSGRSKACSFRSTAGRRSTGSPIPAQSVTIDTIAAQHAARSLALRAEDTG